MAGKLTAFVTETDPWDAKVDIASKYGNGWMRLNRSGNYKDTINVLPEEVKLSELAKSDIKDIKLDILNDYFGRTLITPQGNLARIIIKTHKDPTWLNRKVKPKFLYSIDAATGREVKDTENFKPGTGFVFADDPETKVRASFVEETVGEGSEKVTYHGFNRARYKNVKKQLYPAWTCTEEPGVATMAFVGRKGNDKVYSDIVFYRVNRRQSKINFVQLDGNNGTISKTYYSHNIVEDNTFDIGGKQYIAIYQPEMAMIRSGDGELVPLEVSATPAGDYIPASNDSLSELMYNDIVTQHSLATRANINEYTPIGGELPGVITTATNFWWFDRTDRISKSVVEVPISKVDYTPSKLGLKTAQEWNELDEANRLYDDTPIWLAELVIPLGDGVYDLFDNNELGGSSNDPYFSRMDVLNSSDALLRIPCKPVSGPISKDLNNYFGFVPINDQYLEIANGPHLWHGPLRTNAGDISRLANEAKQLKGKVTFQNDALGFMGVIYRGLVNNSIGARKWLEWQVNLWLATYMGRRNNISNGGISDVNCTLQTTDGVVYNATFKFSTRSGNGTKIVNNFINLNTINVIYHKDMAAYRDNGFKQRDGFINSMNLNNVGEIAYWLEYAWGFRLSPNDTPNKEYWMKYIIPRINFRDLWMRVAVMIDGVNLKPTYAYQDIPLHGFIHTGLSFLNRIPENNPDNRKSNTVYKMFDNNVDPTQRSEYLHLGGPDYLNGNRGNLNNPVGYFRLPANTEVQSIVSRYNFDPRNTNATYITQGDGWGYTGNADRDNWHRGNLHQLVNFEPAASARLFRDKPIYTMIPWENGQVDYQYIRGYLHGRVSYSNSGIVGKLSYRNNSDKTSGQNARHDVILGGYFPCLAGNYFKNRYSYDVGAPPELRQSIRAECDVTPLVRVISQSPLVPHEWKPYEGNVAKLIDGASSAMIENPLYDYMDEGAWYRKVFDGYTGSVVPTIPYGYSFNKKDHPITTYDHHIDMITLQDGPMGLINQFILPNYNRADHIYNLNKQNNPRYRSILYTRRRAVVLGIGKTYGADFDPMTVDDLRGVNNTPQIENSPQSWLITVGLDILIEHAKRTKGTPKDLKYAFAKIFAKHGIPDSKWLSQWEQGPEVFFLRNEIWLDYFFAASKLVPKNIITNGNYASYISIVNVELGINITSDPRDLYHEYMDTL